MKKEIVKKLLKLAYRKLREREIPLTWCRIDASSGIDLIPRVNGIYISRKNDEVWFDTYRNDHKLKWNNCTGQMVRIADIPMYLKKHLPANGKCRYIEIKI